LAAASGFCTLSACVQILAAKSKIAALIQVLSDMDAIATGFIEVICALVVLYILLRETFATPRELELRLAARFRRQES
jgi:hypothetical protein